MRCAQVGFERSTGTIAGGTLGYVTILVGHRMLEASDILFTGRPTPRPCTRPAGPLSTLPARYHRRLPACTSRPPLPRHPL